MNPILQKMQSWHRHKKATSTFQHMNYHYPYEADKQKQKQKQDPLRTNLHKRAKSFSRDSHKIQLNHENYVQRFNGKFSDQIKAQLNKPNKKAKNQRSLKQKKQDFIRDYIKSQSESRKYNKKEKFKIQLKPAKSSPDNKSNSKSAKKFKAIKQQKSFKFKVDSKQKKLNSKQISRQKTSKDSKTSKTSKHKKSQQFSNINKIHQKRDFQNKLGRQKKGIEINFKNISLKDHDFNSQNFPMTPQQTTEKFKEILDEVQIGEMKEYKYIYFLGRDFNEKEKKLIYSARQNIRDGKIENQEDTATNNFKKHQYFETQNLPVDKKIIDQSQDISQFYKYSIGSHIAYRYEIISSINRGSFGEVLRVFDHKTKQFLAIKVVKKSKQLVQQTFVQISILTHVKQSDKGNTSGIVRIKDFLLFRNHICIIFELLDGNLYQLLTANGFKGFNEDIIRLFAVQILNSLNFLRRQKIIHCDLKPQNLVMKNWGKSGIKLIDFGTSCFEGKQMYSYLQSRYYRAPQVFMQMPYSFPIDMWSFGCMMAQFKLGQPMFSGRSTVQQLIYICSSIGLPNKNDGLFSLAFLENDSLKQVISKNYIDLYKESTFTLGENLFFQKYKEKLKKQCIMSLQERLSKKSSINPYFLDFLQKILVWQPDKRLTPEQALRHPWITKGLSSEFQSLYSNFHTTQSCSKSKKNSKDSKKSNQSKSKSNRQNNKKIKKDEITAKIINNDNEKPNEENKINFVQKRLVQEELYSHQKQRSQIEGINDDNKRVKLNKFLIKKEVQNLNRGR